MGLPENYDEAIGYLYDLRMFGMKLGLDATTHLLSSLDDPLKHFRTIHVGGTNGKGSVCAMLDVALREAGYKVGRFTSPHVHSFRERILVGGRPIPEEALLELVRRIAPIAKEREQRSGAHPTYFEVATAIALEYFRRQSVDMVILEVGMGGALDATNVVKPLVAVITNVEMDHMDHLGRTSVAISGEKAGIIKTGVPVVTATRSHEALDVISDRCNEMGCELTLIKEMEGETEGVKENDHVDSKIYFHSIEVSKEGTTATVETQKSVYPNMMVPLVGHFQAENLAVSLGVLEKVQDLGLEVNEENMRRGLGKTSLPGRVEIVPGHPEVVFDVAHNPSGAIALASTLRHIYPDKKLHFLVAIMANKDIPGILEPLLPLASEITITRPDITRAAQPEDIADHIQPSRVTTSIVVSVQDAIDSVLTRAKEDDVICVTGSFYLVGEARGYLCKYRDIEVCPP